MNVLLVKLSSLGDVLHLLPALTDLHRRMPGQQVDWLVEPAFAEIPAWHPVVRHVIPVGLRRLKKTWWGAPSMLLQLRRTLGAQDYTYVVDAQGLVKSAVLARLAGVPVFGLDASSARESLASRFYQRGFAVERHEHAITRNRQLLAQVFDYSLDDLPLDYGLGAFRRQLRAGQREDLAGFVGEPFIVGLHGTTWDTKHWPEPYWQQLARLCAQEGLRLLLPWGNAAEQARAQRIQQVNPGSVMVLPSLDLHRLAWLLVRAEGFVGVDTGLAHLAAALDVPGVSLYGPTDPVRTGVMGLSQHVLAGATPCAPCLKRHCNQPRTAEGLVACQASLMPEAAMAALKQVRVN
ncbi:lipopolysaccharide heptosyltransferase I [Thermithiobacillus plumbiphilus]|uniref:Lipopolysaccharide heptosyltransferase 1 n=1 Tax=Thermithiobacillus plumbiphilus TaxID=1729899 RepID=A0ABU9DBA7_9PROT